MNKQKGAALLMAIACAALVAALASAALVRQSQLIEQEQKIRDDRQAMWLLQGALDWARLVLRQHAMASQIDHLGEPWAIPIEGASLSDFISLDKSVKQISQVVMSGRITDAQSKINFYERIKNQGDISKVKRENQWDAVYDKLEKIIQTPSKESWKLNDEVKKFFMAESAKEDAPLLPSNFEGFVDNWGNKEVGQGTFFAPYMTLLPDIVGVNVNTASAEVIASLIPDLSIEQARLLVQNRALNPFGSVEAFTKKLPSSVVIPAEVSSMLSVSSCYFEVDLVVKMEKSSFNLKALLKRSGQTVSVIAFKRINL